MSHHSRGPVYSGVLFSLVMLVVQPEAVIQAQELILPDSLSASGKKISSPFSTFLFYSETKLTELFSSLKPVNPGHGDPDSRIYFDSLRVKASKTAFGKRLYDLAVAEPESLSKRKTRSHEDFSPYNGLHINKITFIRLDPFGTSINNPELQPEKEEIKFLNRTHIRSREGIIERYLLFSEGDTIYELSLSETERNLRRLTFINDARILVRPTSDYDAEIVVITRDSYSMGADFSYSNPGKWEASVYERNLAGAGHSIELGIPYDDRVRNKTGITLGYNINNVAHSFANLELFFKSVPGEKNYGFRLRRDFISAESDYAGGVTLKEVFTKSTADTITEPVPLEFTYQDYWMARALLVDRSSLSRIIFGVRYIHNNVYERPDIDPLSYYHMQKYRLYLASLSFSTQHFFKENFIYSYGRTEDVPYGLLASVTAGREINEFKTRTYLGAGFSWGNTPGKIGYLNLSVSTSAFLTDVSTEQGVIDLSVDYFTRLFTAGFWRIRGFAGFSHTYGFDRYSDEYLTMGRNDIITGFRNDSIRGRQRSVLNLETVAFSPLKLYGFRFSFFSFADFAFLGKGVDLIPGTAALQGLGAGVRIRNDNLVISTFQLRLTWYPTLPPYTDRQLLRLSGEPLLRLKGFDAGPPSIVLFR